MKEAFWGILIVSLGLLGVVIVNVFQRVTTGNDQTYYLLKETAEAASYDSIDLQYYRLNGDLRIVEEKFVENFARRFSESVSALTNYNIKVEAINEVPPRISVSVKTSVTSIGGDTFGINNRVDAVLETKYGIKDITDFLGITENEWINRINQNTSGDAKACKITTLGSEERECISGDLEFSRWEELTIPKNICDDGTYGKEKRTAYYKVCECGIWKEEEQEVEDTPTKTGREYIYDWKLHVDGEIRDIDAEERTKHYIDKCTTGIEIYAPIDLIEKEPSTDNSKYFKCPAGGITVNDGQTLVLHANYIPGDATNRIVKWTHNNDKALSLQYSNPLTETGYSRASITGLKVGEETLITATTTNGHTATCKVTVLDGYADSVSCANNSVTAGSQVTMSGSYLPKTATKTKLEWSSGDTSRATINAETGVATGVSSGDVTITVKSKNLYDNTEVNSTCNLKVNPKPSTPDGGSSTTTGGECSCKITKTEKVWGWVKITGSDCGKLICTSWLRSRKCTGNICFWYTSGCARGYWPTCDRYRPINKSITKDYPGTLTITKVCDSSRNTLITYKLCTTSSGSCGSTSFSSC